MNRAYRRRHLGAESRKYRCPKCGKNFRTRPSTQIHLWSEAISIEVDRSVDEVERGLRHYRAEGLLRLDPLNGDLIGAWSRMGALGADVQAALRRISEEEQEEERSGAQRSK